MLKPSLRSRTPQEWETESTRHNYEQGAGASPRGTRSAIRPGPAATARRVPPEGQPRQRHLLARRRCRRLRGHRPTCEGRQQPVGASDRRSSRKRPSWAGPSHKAALRPGRKAQPRPPAPEARPPGPAHQGATTAPNPVSPRRAADTRDAKRRYLPASCGALRPAQRRPPPAHPPPPQPTAAPPAASAPQLPIAPGRGGAVALSTRWVRLRVGSDSRRRHRNGGRAPKPRPSRVTRGRRSRQE